MLRRLNALEAEQAKSQQTIKALRSEIKTLRTENKAIRTETKYEQLNEQKTRTIPTSETEIPADDLSLESPSASPAQRGGAIFPELANESQFVFRTESGDFSLGIDGTIIGRYEVNRRKDDGTGSSNTDQGYPHNSQHCI